jgi:hypothetical protein
MHPHPNTKPRIYNRWTAMAVLVVLLNSTAAMAKTPKPAKPAPPEPEQPELILSPDDEWFEDRTLTTDDANLTLTPPAQTPQWLADQAPKKPSNLGCDIDISPYGSMDHSMSERLTGQCKLRYQY